MKTILPLLICLCSVPAFSQSADPSIISAQGGNAKGSSMSMSWTIGDLVTETSRVDETIYTQGFQQPVLSVQEIDPQPLTDTEQADQLTSDVQGELKASVFPNPFGADITVSVENEKMEYYLEIFDPSGSLLYRIQSSSPQEKINFNQLPVAQYLLKIGLVDSGESKVFRIIKSH